MFMKGGWYRECEEWSIRIGNRRTGGGGCHAGRAEQTPKEKKRKRMEGPACLREEAIRISMSSRTSDAG